MSRVCTQYVGPHIGAAHRYPGNVTETVSDKGLHIFAIALAHHVDKRARKQMRKVAGAGDDRVARPRLFHNTGAQRLPERGNGGNIRTGVFACGVTITVEPR